MIPDRFWQAGRLAWTTTVMLRTFRAKSSGFFTNIRGILKWI